MRILAILLVLSAGCGTSSLEQVATAAAPVLLEAARQHALVVDRDKTVCVDVTGELTPDDGPGVVVVCYAPAPRSDSPAE